MPRNGGPSRARLVVTGLVVLSLAADAVLLARLVRYRQETARLRQGMTEGQRERADLVVAAERHRVRVELELIRRQARGSRDLHLAVNVDSGHMILERDGVILRTMPVQLTSSTFAGARGDSLISVGVLGERSVARVVSANEPWELPESVFRERGLPVPEDRSVRGALGDNALVLNDGTVVYAPPDEGPLADPSVSLPGSVRLAPVDLQAVSANIRPGMSIYFYR